MAHAGGRPTKYDPIFIDSVDEYLATTGKEQTHLPKIESFAIFLNVSKDSLYEWESATYPADYQDKALRGTPKYPGFSDALDKIRTRQHEQLVDDGIYGGKEVNATIVKLLLQNNHGYRERTDITSDDKELKAPHITISTKREEVSESVS